MKLRTLIFLLLALAGVGFIVFTVYCPAGFGRSGAENNAGQVEMTMTTAPATTPAQLHVVDVTDSNYKAEVQATTDPVIIDFSATWCDPCRRFGPVFDKVSGQYQQSGGGKVKVKFCKVDVDQSPQVASLWNIRAVPTIVLVKPDGKGGLVYVSTSGYHDETALKKFIDDALKPGAQTKPAPSMP